MKEKLELFLVFFTNRSHSGVMSRQMFKNILSFVLPPTPLPQGVIMTINLPDFRHT